MPVSKRLRFEVLRRDGHRCRYCGAGVSDEILTVDHVTPIALGGTDLPDNLVAACEPCNAGKTSTIPGGPTVAGPTEDAVRWARAIRQAAAELEDQQESKKAYQASFKDTWGNWTYPSGDTRKTVDLAPDWDAALERFRQAGLPLAIWPDIIRAAMTSQGVKVDKIFQRCCTLGWHKVAEMQERSKAILDDDGSARGTKNSRRNHLVREAALQLWYDDMGGDDEPTAVNGAAEFSRSLDALSGMDLLEPWRILEAAEHATYFGFTSIKEGQRELDYRTIWSAWSSAWPTTYVPGDPDIPFSGKFTGGPNDDANAAVKEQIDKFLDAGVSVFRVAQAATYAGFNKSTQFYCGLTSDELATTGRSEFVARAGELWRKGFDASAGREPNAGERKEFLAHLKRAADSGDFWIADIWTAAAMAGIYQDADISTCLSSQLSAVSAATLPFPRGAADA